MSSEGSDTFILRKIRNLFTKKVYKNLLKVPLQNELFFKT